MTIIQRISIHAPREGSDLWWPATESTSATFLSTLPVRGATVACAAPGAGATYFYPRSP